MLESDNVGVPFLFSLSFSLRYCNQGLQFIKLDERRFKANVIAVS
jgi:hypothetical protein